MYLLCYINIVQCFYKSFPSFFDIFINCTLHAWEYIYGIPLNYMYFLSLCLQEFMKSYTLLFSDFILCFGTMNKFSHIHNLMHAKCG